MEINIHSNFLTSKFVIFKQYGKSVSIKHNFCIIHNMTSAPMYSVTALSVPQSWIFIHITKKFPMSQTFCHNSLGQLGYY